MASRDGPNGPRKKTITYGRTSRKRPIHTFLELSNDSRHPVNEHSGSTPTISDDPTGDACDIPNDEQMPHSTARRAASSASHPRDGKSSDAGSFKKRRIPAATVANNDRTAGTGMPAALNQSTTTPVVRRLKPSPRLAPNTSSPPVALCETETPTSAAAISSARTQCIPKPRWYEQARLPASKIDQSLDVSLQLEMVDGGGARRPSLDSEPTMQRFKSILETAAEVSSRSSGRRRVRLIDQLAAQIEDFYESDSGDSRLSEGVDGHPVRSPAVVTKLVEPVGSTPKLPTRPKPLASTRKLRSTYGEHRSLRPNESEEGLGNYTAICDDQDKLSPPPSLSKMPSFPLEEESLDEELSPTGGIIDIHALRQAGANHRFADMMVDLLDRVGSPQPPSSPLSRTRRTALLELASNFRDKVYVRQFRDQAAKDALFKAIGAEEDIVCGFALFSILLVMFSSHSVPHLIPLLHTEGMAQLALRLFNIEDDILRFAIQRRTNLSKTSQATLGVIKSTIQQIDVWKGMPPPVLSPRTLALKAISQICKDNDSPDTRQILANLTDRLFDFVHNGWEVSRDDGMAVTDGGIALCLLESYSIAAMESDAGPIWTSRHLPVVADMITSAMARPVMNFGEFECTALKLALNTTNNNPAAANVFSRGELLSVLAETSLGAFELLQQSVCSGAFSKEVYEMLMLTLGILINTSEHCISTHESVDAWQAQSRSPLNKLMDFYLDNRESSVMADSVEKTSVAVAHGYLAILLGYLSLGSRVRRRLEEKSQGSGTTYLLNSIQQFMNLHDKVETDEMTTSLQRLVSELRHRRRAGS